MPLFFIIWDDENETHIAEHGITAEEFREVLEAATNRAIVPNKVPGRLEVIGETDAGRLLKLVFEPIDGATIYPITAFDLGE